MAFPPQLLWPLIGLILAIGLGVAFIALAKRWRQQNRENQGSPGDDMAHYRRLLDEGLLDQEEFDRIRQNRDKR